MHPQHKDLITSSKSSSSLSAEDSSSNTSRSSFLQNLIIGNANYRFLIGQIVTCMVFIIYGVLMMLSTASSSTGSSTSSNGVVEEENLIQSFLIRSHYTETILLFIVILIPIYLLFTFSVVIGMRKKQSSTTCNDSDSTITNTSISGSNSSSPSELLIQMVLKYFAVLFGGACVVYALVTLFGFTPFMRISSSNNFQSARSDVEAPMNSSTGSNPIDWICAKKNIPTSILNSDDHIVFSLFSKCHVFSIDEMRCCIVWCILTSLVVFVQPLATLLQWNNVKEYIYLVVFEKTARVSSISFNLKPVVPLRHFLLVHLVCIWISGFVIPLDWEKDWQYFPLCTTVGLIFGSVSNLVRTLIVTMKEDTKED